MKLLKKLDLWLKNIYLNILQDEIKMVNFSDVANRDIFKCSVKLANILDITPEYAKENQEDENKLLYFIES